MPQLGNFLKLLIEIRVQLQYMFYLQWQDWVLHILWQCFIYYVGNNDGSADCFTIYGSGLFVKCENWQ